MITNQLQAFGLSEKEARMYVTNLELGEATIQRIADKAKVKRTTAYDILDTLKQKGLLSVVLKKKRKYFVASDPRELEAKLEQRKHAIKSIIPELLSISNLIDNKPKIRFYEGEEGIKEIYLDTLNYPEKPLWAWVTSDVWQVIDEDFISYYLQQRVKKGIWAYVIAPGDKKIIREYQALDSRFLRKTKLETNPDCSFEVEIDLYGGYKIGIMAFKERFGLVIESQKIYNTIKSIFDANWDRLH